MSHLSQHVDKFKKRNLIISIIAVVVVLAVGYALKSSRAAGFFSVINPNGTTVSGNATLVSDTSLAGGKALQFNAPATTPPPTTPPPTTPPPTTPPSGTLMGWQVTADKVGLKPHGLSCDTLPVYTGPTTLPAGTTISGKRIEGRLDASKGNIVIEKSCIRPKSGNGPLISAAYLDGSNNRKPDGPITVRDSELNASLLSRADAANSDGVRGFPTTFQRNYIHSMGSGIAMLLTGTSGDALIENNYVHKLTWDGGSKPSADDDTHSDGFTIRDFAGTGRTMIVKNNRFDCSGGHESGAYFIQTWLGPINNVTAEGNLLEGGGWVATLNRFNYDYSGMKAINNRFNPFGGYGAGTVDKGAGWAQWTENYMYDASKTDAKGAVVPRP